ncbi:MAG: hypothetical protein KJP27_00235, partial [Altererythrobacter sp.]|nr:hypothetical protein [Altererythrobacter sp.]
MLTSIIATLLLQSAPANNAEQPSAPPPIIIPPAGCDTIGHAGFDFWLGEWDVYPTGGDTKVADSRIERKHSDCAVIENWMPLQGAGGTSLNHWDVAAQVWRQKWVGSSA